MASVDPERLVFLDESGCKRDMVRRYGRAQNKKRVVDHAPLNAGKNTTVLSSIRLNGDKRNMIFSGSLNGTRFVSYLEETLSLGIQEGDIVVMDNLSSHRVEGVEQAISAMKATVKYLPPYSPDLNPIEMMWSKMKAILRKMKCRIAEELPQAIAFALSQVTVEDCKGWFRGCGYIS